MSHDETSGPVTRSAGDIRSSERKERRAAYGGKRQKAPRYVFSAAAHVREDWLPEDLIDMLESRARGYNGTLRQVLCTAAQRLRDQQNAIARLSEAAAFMDPDLADEMRVQGERAEMVDASVLMPVGVEDDGS